MQQTITCTNCNTKMSLDEALLQDIKTQTKAAFEKEQEQKIAEIQAQAELRLQKQLKEALEIAENDFKNKEVQKVELLKTEAEAQKNQNQELRQQLTDLMAQLVIANKQRNNAEIEMQKKLLEEEGKIRAEAEMRAEEKQRLDLAKKEKTITDLQAALADAQRKASQGSQQMQGEVLELELEMKLREVFPFDDITEVKKGQKGADIIQAVKNMNQIPCGIILWETKNGKWQPSWIAKFKQDVREAKASIGVIVSEEMPTEYGEMHHLEKNIWLVKPRLSHLLASALRATITQVDAANKMNKHKDQSMEVLYQFLVGSEFQHRIEAIVENYNMLQTEMEKEKRSTQLRWSRQEKAIRNVIDNTFGMYGDLQGITNQALPAIKSLESGEEEVAEDLSTMSQ